MKYLNLTPRICSHFLILTLTIIQCSLGQEIPMRQLQQTSTSLGDRHFLQVKSNTLYLQKSLNSYQKITLPFDKIFTIQSSLFNHQFASFISFSPTSIKLSQQKHSKQIKFQHQNQNKNHKIQIQGVPIILPNIQNDSNYSLIDDLRSPFQAQMSEIIVLNQEKLIFLYVFPNKVFVLEQIQNGQLISIKNTYHVNLQKLFNNSNYEKYQLSAESIDFYSLRNEYVIGFIQQTNQFLLFSADNYTILKNQVSISKLQHLHSLQNGQLEFLTAEMEDGFKHCKVNLQESKVQVISKFKTFEDIELSGTKNIENLTIYDISFDRISSKVYLLDYNQGVIEFSYPKLFKTSPNKQNEQQQSKSQVQSSKLIIKQEGCEALDYILNEKFVLICQHRRRRFFIEAYFSTEKNQFIKQSPTFHNCYFDDLQITPNFYVTFEQSSIDIFWPSKRNFIPELVHNKKHLNLIGMQTFKINQDKNGHVFLYSARNNILHKQKISQEKYLIKIGSKVPMKKSFQIGVFGNCQILAQKLNQKIKRYSVAFHKDEIQKLNNHIKQKSKSQDQRQLLCKIIVPIEFQASEFIIENRTKFAFAAGIFIICLLIGISLICICMQKYKGMEKKAKQTLRLLQSQRNSSPQFTL